ncbi:MAG: O-antigen ligase family protein [Pyrinomonadaceae bacterium]
MVDQLNTKTPVIRLENVSIGDGATRLSASIFILLCAIPIFATILFGAVDGTTWIIISLAWAAIILLWLIEAWRAHGLIFSASVIQLPMIGLLVIGLIQLLPFGSGVPGDLLGVPAANAISLDPYATRFFLTRLVVYIFFFAACLTFINTEKRLKLVVWIVIIFGASMAFLGILQRLADPETIYGIRIPFQAIPFGPFINQHHFAAFMEMTGGVALGLLFGRTSARDKKFLLAIALVVMVVALVLTSSRGGVISFLSLFAFVHVLHFFTRTKSEDNSLDDTEPKGINKTLTIAAAGAGVVFAILGVVIFLGGDESLVRGLGLTSMPGEITNGRTHFWDVAIKIFLDHPVLGAGLDAFGVAFTRYDSWNGMYRVEQAHNEYLQTLADSGLAGLVCLAAFIYFLFKKGLAGISNAGNTFRRDAAIGALAGCLGILIHSFVDFPLRTPSNAFFFLMLAAIATISIKTADEKATHRRKKRRSTAP